MSGNKSFARSMNGINNIEINEVQFPDGSTITSASNLVQLDTTNDFTSNNSFNSNLPTSTKEHAVGELTDNMILNKKSADLLYSGTDENDFITGFSRNGNTGEITLTQSNTGDPITSETITTITDTQLNAIGTNTNNTIKSVDFNTGNGILTLTKDDDNTLTKDLDGRYFHTLVANDIPNLNASKITEGTIDAERIPDLPYVSVGTEETHDDETIYGIKTFHEPPVCSTQPTTNFQLANREYVLSVASSGIGDAVLNAGTEASPQTFAGVNTFDSVNLKGNVFTENGAGTLDSPFRRSVFGNTFTTINAGSKWIKIATLPATSSTTVDITKVVLTGGDWTNEPMIITAWFRNRSGFKYQYKIEGNNEDNNGGTFTNVYLFARSVSGGAVDIWIFLDGISNYAVANWNIDTIDAVLYKNPSSQSSPPTAGTTLFSSGNNTSYPPNIITRQAHHSFHASWNTPSPTNYGFSQGNVFKPNFIWSNIGSCYSSTTGKFTAKIRGVYMFKFSAFTNQSSGSISRPTLYKNGVDRTISGNTISQNGNQVMAIIPLDIGDLVHSASSYGHLYLYSHYMYNQFSGSLIAPY